MAPRGLGFRDRVRAVPPEVAMLGTALNALSVGCGVGLAIACAAVLRGLAAWPVGGFIAAGGYVLVESAEVLLAERIQARSGDREAEREEH